MTTWEPVLAALTSLTDLTECNCAIHADTVTGGRSPVICRSHRAELLRRLDAQSDIAAVETVRTIGERR
jgi:hypothetical protein